MQFSVQRHAFLVGLRRHQALLDGVVVQRVARQPVQPRGSQFHTATARKLQCSRVLVASAVGSRDSAQPASASEGPARMIALIGAERLRASAHAQREHTPQPTPVLAWRPYGRMRPIQRSASVTHGHAMSASQMRTSIVWARPPTRSLPSKTLTLHPCSLRRCGRAHASEARAQDQHLHCGSALLDAGCTGASTVWLCRRMQRKSAGTSIRRSQWRGLIWTRGWGAARTDWPGRCVRRRSRNYHHVCLMTKAPGVTQAQGCGARAKNLRLDDSALWWRPTTTSQWRPLCTIRNDRNPQTTRMHG